MPQLRCLLVEDDPQFRALLRAFVQRAGLEPVEAGSLAEARKLIGQVTFDVAVLDFHLGDGSANDVIAELDRAGRSPVVLVLSSDRSAAGSLPAGRVKSFLQKPLDTVAFRAALFERPATALANAIAP